jgi:hypothetical protein
VKMAADRPGTKMWSLVDSLNWYSWFISYIWVNYIIFQ